MTGRLATFAKAWLFLLAVLCAPAAAAHSATPAAPSCHAHSEIALPMQEAAASLEWVCEAEGWRDGTEYSWLRFDDWDRAQPPRVFTSRMTIFDGVTLAALDEDGSIRVREYAPSEAKPVLASPIFSLELPEATEHTRSILVRIDRPHSITVASEASLRADPDSGVSTAALVLLALVAGMLVMPFLFDIIFFLVLRERFVLLHAAIAVSMFAYVLTSGGVITAFVELPVPLLAIAGPLSWAFGAGFTGFFITAFLERDVLPLNMRRAVIAAAAIAGIGSGFCALQLGFSQRFDNTLYFLCMAPLLPIYSAAIGYALRRGSRAARYLAAAWSPIFLAAGERMLRGLGLYAASDSIDQALFFALGLEVIVIALGVGDRFLSIRRERDQAVTKANTMKMLSERDALTGLFNRRMIEERYALLRQEGFGTMAVIDLDYFKRINDTFGHARGDDVLKVAGKALASDDPDIMAFRMGGEEFLLLLRGEDSVERAERRRQEIARLVANENLGCLVTASMGIVQVSGGALPGASFAAVYARADRLLYQAKASGRNRMVCERIKAFRPRRRDRRAAA